MKNTVKFFPYNFQTFLPSLSILIRRQCHDAIFDNNEKSKTKIHSLNGDDTKKIIINKIIMIK